MKKSIQLVEVHAEEFYEISLEELCQAFNLSPDQLEEFIAYGIIEPISKKQKHFHSHHIQRVKTTLRLQHDLKINLAGAAVILDLLDELNDLRNRMLMLEKNRR